jgi:type IV pilus assembly protein PilP
MKKYLKIPLWFAIILLPACVDQGMEDLKKEVEQIKAEKKVALLPMPAFPTETIVPYEGGTKRSPFEDFDKEKKDAVDHNANNNANALPPGCIRPDTYRNKEPLEGFPLDSLIMVGTLEEGNNMWALISDPQKIVHMVKVNNYVGQNYGKITSILENKIDVVELYSDEIGCYFERSAAITMKE